MSVRRHKPTIFNLMGVLHEYIYIIYRHKIQLKCMYIEIYFSHITKKSCCKPKSMCKINRKSYEVHHFPCMSCMRDGSSYQEAAAKTPTIPHSSTRRGTRRKNPSVASENTSIFVTTRS